MGERDEHDRDAARERRLRWLVFGGVAAFLVVMAVVFVVVGELV